MIRSDTNIKPASAGPALSQPGSWAWSSSSIRSIKAKNNKVNQIPEVNVCVPFLFDCNPSYLNPNKHRLTNKTFLLRETTK